MDAGTATQNRPRRFAPRRLLQAMGDERLVDHIRKGNDVAFEILYDRHHRGLLSFCRHMLGTREEAEDALQQTFLSAYNDLQKNDREIKVQAWLYTIARNRCLSVLRARRETASDEIELSTAGLSEEVEQRADLRELLADMAQLPEQQRAALVLSELGDLSHQEVAGVVGVETPKVKSLVFQARTALLENRDARDASHEEIREQLSIPGATRRKEVKRHLASCPSCSENWEQVRRQRALLGVILPVVPTIALKDGILAAAGFGGAGAAGSVGATAAAGGGFTAAAGGMGAGKLAVLAIVASGAAAGGGAVYVAARDSESKPASSVSAQATPAGSSGAAFGTTSQSPSAGANRAGERSRAAANRQRRRAAQRRATRRRNRGVPASPGSPGAPIIVSAAPPAQSSSAPRSSSPPSSGGGGSAPPPDNSGGGSAPPPDNSGGGSEPPPDNSGGGSEPPPAPPAEPTPPPALNPGPRPCSNPVTVGPDGSVTPQPC